MFDKLLSAKSRIHAHDKHHIHIPDNILQQSYRSSRIDGYGRLHPRFPDLLYPPMQMRTSLIVHIHRMSAQRLYFRDEFFRINNHQMHIQRFLTQLRYILQYRKAE